MSSPVDDDENDDNTSSTNTSSSIGSPSSDDDHDHHHDDDDAQSNLVVDSNASFSSFSTSSGLCSLGSLTALEDSLPIKKGLSGHYIGKSRSFANLTQCGEGNVTDLAKPENPFNKRRRVQIQSRLSYKRRASCSALIMTELPPLRLMTAAPVEEDEEERGDVSSDNDDASGGTPAVTRRSFPLFDV